ncbi:hypothetical protein Lal_00041175 [Lupinus albus]|nr:hypothetical protein Lal_00041175 [Lupinus albus]
MNTGPQAWLWRGRNTAKASRCRPRSCARAPRSRHSPSPLRSSRLAKDLPRTKVSLRRERAKYRLIAVAMSRAAPHLRLGKQSSGAGHGRAFERQVEAAEPSYPPAAGRRRLLLERGRALQHLADAPSAGGEEGRRRRSRHAAGILHHHRHRWHRHGPWRDARLAALAGGHRRFGRADHARPRLRRPRGPRGLRQVPAGHDDGHGAPQRAVDLHLWRLDPAGSFRGKPVTVQDLFEAVGKVAVGDMSLEDLDELEQVACPSAGACGAQFTANTMATVSEAIGLALPYSAGAPAPYEIRDKFCATAGEKVMELLAKQIRPRDIVTRKALENAAATVAASGGSTNAALHLPAIAHECGIEFTLFDVAESSGARPTSRT